MKGSCRDDNGNGHEDNGKGHNGNNGNGKRGVVGYGDFQSTAEALYWEHYRLIVSVAKRYRNLDMCVDFGEFLSEGFIAVCKALRFYDSSKKNGKAEKFKKILCKDCGIKEKEAIEYLVEKIYNGNHQNNGIDYSTCLHWYLQKRFEKLTPPKVVLISPPNGSNGNGHHNNNGNGLSLSPETITYNEFQRRKKKLESEGWTFTVKNITVPLSEYTDNNKKMGCAYEE